MPLNWVKTPTIGTRVVLGLGLIGLVLVAAPLAMYIVESSEAIQSARLKQVGIAPSQALLRMVQLLQQHRGLSTNVLGGDTTREPQRAATQIAADTAVEVFDAMVSSDIRDPVFAADWRMAVEDWKRLAYSVTSRTITGRESLTRHTALITANLKLLDHLLDAFGLSYDPSGKEYHVVMATLVHLPQLTEFLGQMRAHGSLHLTSKRILPVDRRTIVGLISDVERQHWHVKHELDKAVARNPHLRAELYDIAVPSMVVMQKAVYLARTQVVEAEVLSYSSTEYWEVFTQAIDAQFTLINKGVAVLQGALHARITALQNAQFKTIGLTVLVMALAIGLGMVIIRALRQDIAMLKQSEEAERHHANELEVTVERLQRAQDKLEAHQRRWKGLHQLEVLLSQSLRLNEVYPAFAAAVKALVPYDRIRVVVPEETQLRMVLSIAEPPLASLQGSVWPKGEGCTVEWILAHKTFKLAQDLKTEATFCDEVYLVQEGIRSTISIPLLAGGEAMGVLSLDHCAPQAFSQEDLELLRPMAEQLALAIHNAHLYEEQRSAAIQLTAKVQELEQTQSRLIEGERLRAMGQMAVGVAHDFNNALMGVLGQAQLMRLFLEQGPVASALRGVEGYADLMECLARQEQAAQDAAETIRKIREATRPRGAEAFGPVALNGVVEQVCAITRPRWKDQAEAAGVRMTVQTALAETPPVLGHAAELREALTNLVFNALDAMPLGGIVTITTRHVPRAAPGTPKSSGVVEISVTDTGAGMSQAVQARLFEPFFTTKGVRGTGLGLSMVRGIVNRHEGEITVESVEGKGTTVTLRLPVAMVADEVAPLPAPPLALPGPLKLLVIDDELLLAKTLKDLLRTLGHEAAIATNGKEGLALLAAERFDLVLTDLGMAEVSGWDVASAVKARWPQLPVILVTGWGDEVEREALEGTGVDLILAKPYTVVQLKHALATACRTHPAREHLIDLW